MSWFKSGIILKTRCVAAQGEDDSHSALLEELKIEDTMGNAMRKFVRAELLPPDDAWWTDPDTWKFHVDQDILPEWFEKDREKYETEFRTVVKEWWSEHVFTDKKIDKLACGYYRLKRCEVGKLLNDVKVMLWSSTIHEMCDSSTVQEMSGSSTVQEMSGNSTVQEMYDSSTIQRMYGSSTVQEMYDSSTVQEMYDSSTVQRMHDSSTVQEMYGNSTVQRMSDRSAVERMYETQKIT